MKKVLYFLCIIITLGSCGESTKKSQTTPVAEATQEEEITYTKKQLKELKTASKVVYNLPSPSEMAKILYDADAIYDTEILNDPKALNKYYTDASRALNLGVYFADLSFTSMYDYPQQAMLFMSAAQGLSEDLNIVGIFNESLMTRLEENLTNKDSLMEIVSRTYMETDFYLQENDRTVIAKAILAGAWVEGLYIATHLKTKENGESGIWEKIGKQKNALSNLINMVEDCNDPQLKSFIEKLRVLEATFGEVEIKEEQVDTSNSEIDVPIIKTIQVSEKSKEKIKQETSACRTHIVRPK